MNALRIGSLFTGTGALDLAVMDVFDAEVVWHSQYEPPDKNGKEDKNQYAAKILARHWLDVPNLGDVTAIDWQAVIEEHGPVDILTGGFPCQDVSSAGKRAGLTADSRSGLWTHFARAIHELNPRLVVIENVEGLLSAPADRGLGLDAEALEEEADAGRILRALGAVLGDLATLGFHAEWERVGADEVGAPHRRRRIVIYAWPADADPADLGHERGRSARDGRPGPANGGVAAADADGRRREEHQERHRGPAEGQPERERGLDLVGRGVQRAAVLGLRDGEPDLDWGPYEPAIRRWERILGRRAPWPTDLRGRLTPVFSEWMMGLPDGWVTCTPGPEGMSPTALRNAMLRALGNGVVWQQGAHALRLLHGRAVHSLPERQAA